LGRQDPDLFLRQDVPVTFMAFDILWIEGQGLLDEPLEHRRGILASIASRHPVHVAVGRTVRDAPALRAAFDEARGQGHEGLVIKDPASPYLPGRRGLGWVKLKKAMPTLDCVIVGAEYGHGRRRGVLSDYTFALRDADTGRLQVVGKAYSGLSDEEMNVLTSRLLARVLRREGSFHEVEPEVVLEIAFDRIQASGRHESGLALRFPRIVRVRDDKAPDACDTVQAARALMGATPESLD
jgi:DNA ligase-1